MQMWTFYYDCCRTTCDLYHPKVKDSSFTILRDITCHVQCSSSGLCSLKTQSCHRFLNEFSHSLVYMRLFKALITSGLKQSQNAKALHPLYTSMSCVLLSGGPVRPKIRRPLDLLLHPLGRLVFIKLRWHNIAAGSAVSALRSRV